MTDTFRGCLRGFGELLIILVLVPLWLLGVIFFIPTLGWSYEVHRKWYDMWYEFGFFDHTFSGSGDSGLF